MSNELKLIKRKKRELYLHNTEVENLFINELMPDAPGDYVKIYLFCLMYAEQEVSVSMSEILNILDIDRETLDEAWNYWEKNGVVRCLPSEDGDEDDYSVEFIDQIENLYGMKNRQKTRDVQEIADRTEEETLSDADRALVDLDLQGVLREMENGLGRTLSRKEIDSVVTSLKENSVKPEVMSYAIDYSLQMDKRNVNYICKVAENWTTRGCTTMDEVKELLATEGKRWTYYRLVFREMGFSRTPAPGDIEIMDSWLDDMGYTQDQVLQTCRDHAGMQNPSLKYINAVLRNRMLENGGIKKSYASYVKKGEPRTAERSGSPSGTSHDNSKSVGEEPVSPDWKGARKKAEEVTVSRRVLREYYEYLRDQDRKKQEERIREVCAKEPLMKDVLELEKGVNFSSLTAGGQDARKVRAAARKHRAEIEAEKRDLLRSRGYPEDYLEMKYVCSKCKDTGTDNDGRSCTCVKQRAEEAYRWNIRRNQTR